MSKSEENGNAPTQRAAALRYRAGDGAPVIVASGMGHLAEKIVEVAADNGVPVYGNADRAEHRAAPGYSEVYRGES